MEGESKPRNRNGHRIYDSMEGESTPFARRVRGLPSVFEQALRLLDFDLAKWPRFSGNNRASGEEARRSRVMTWVKHNIRLSPAQDRSLVRHAEQRGLTRYKMLGRVVDHGLSAVESGISAPTDMRDIAEEIAAMNVRFAEIERILDRALFTACAGYAYARQAALGGRHTDEAISSEALAAYERQRSLASDLTS
jgi:hypothetical protein